MLLVLRWGLMVFDKKIGKIGKFYCLYHMFLFSDVCFIFCNFVYSSFIFVFLVFFRFFGWFSLCLVHMSKKLEQHTTLFLDILYILSGTCIFLVHLYIFWYFICLFDCTFSVYLMFLYISTYVFILIFCTFVLLSLFNVLVHLLLCLNSNVLYIGHFSLIQWFDTLVLVSQPHLFVHLCLFRLF